MISALTFALLLTQPVGPALISDAPVRVEEGQPAPFTGVCDTLEGFGHTVKRLAAAEAKVKVYEATPPLPVVIIAVVVTAVVVGAATAGITYAATRPKM